ncbi:efflux RND transporter permease subunit [Halothiobacillus sp. DCM-1]|uniref:efflux RND transporter permease subunit n=1 Tax=Halothiobacillus sp. DCM-1 TaxID=3112558 RepID=UPI0032485E1F
MRRHLGLSHFILRHQRSLLFLMLVLTLGGLLTALHLPVALFPSLNFPRIVVAIDAGNRDAEQMVRTVTKPAEQALRAVPGVASISSTTSRGSADVDLRFAWGMDMTRAELQTAAAMNAALPNLPPGTQFRVHRENPTRFPVIAYSLTSDRLSPTELRTLAQYTLSPLLSGIAGVRQVQIQGGDLPEFHVLLDPARLEALGLTSQNVIDALNSGQGQHAIGHLQTINRLSLLLTDGRLHNAEEIGQVVINTTPAGSIRVADVATVRASTVPIYQRITADGKPAVLLMIKQQLGGNTVAIARAVRETLQANANLMPPGVVLKKWYDQSTLIVDSAQSVRDAIVLGVLFAILILFLFLKNGRVTLVALGVVPAVLASTVILLKLFGLDFNIMTLGGMAAAVGLVIDDIIVMIEYLLHPKHAQRHPHLLHPLPEFTRPLIGSSTATVIIFAPLAFLDGVTGAFFKALSLTMAASLILSFLFTWLVVPILLQRLRLKPQRPLDQPDLEHPAEHRLTRLYRRLLAGLLRRRWLLGPVILGIGVTGWLSLTHIPTGFMPEMNEGGFVLDYQTRPGQSLTETNRELMQVEALIRALPEVDTLTRRTGAQLGGGLTEANQGDLFIQLKSPDQQSQVMDRIARDIADKVPGVTVLDINQPMGDLIGDLAGSPRPVVIRLFGESQQELQALAPKVAAAIQSIAGIREVQNGLVIAGDALEFHIDREKAALADLTPGSIVQQLQTLLGGTVATRIAQGEQEVGVRVITPESLRHNPQALGNMTLTNAAGQPVLVREVGHFVTVTGAPEITRYNQKPMVAVSARIHDRGFGATIADVRQALAAPGLLPPGVYYQLSGLYQQQQLAFQGLIMVFITATALVFLSLLFLYERFAISVSIISAPLMAVAGVLLGLWLTGQTLNITSLMGLTMIIGIVTEVAVFYFFEVGRIRTGDWTERLIEAGVRRLRPTVMTSLAAILTLLPLALGIGQGSAMQQPLAIAIISGMIVQIPLALLVMPVIYSLWMRRAPLPASAAAPSVR